jgi:class 3 adenylate cyclase
MLSCPSCGADIPGGFSFCGRCGTPLTSAPASQAEERKVVTVLFCDLVGFTARSDKADPEDVQARLRPYHTQLRREIERFGGTLDKFIGDGVMAVFGAPVAHEDDPERAVRCALGTLVAITELNRTQPALELQVRIGISTGEAVVSLGGSRETEGVVGDVVNTASRLEGVAPVGGIVVGEPTWRATSNLFDYEPLPPVRVKGKTEPLAIWRAVAARSRFGIGVEQRILTPFVGREDELDLLKRLQARSLREHAVQLVTIIGEPGVGKSRLVQELFRFVDAQEELVGWRQGHCLPYGEGIAFWALGEIIKAEAGILESDQPEQAAAKLASALKVVEDDPGEREWISARLAPLIGLTAEAAGAVERSEAFAAWRRFLEAIATRKPLVIVVEDLHWADEALLAFLDHLVDWSSDVPLLMVCTARPELYERAPGWGGGKRNATTLGLSPLSDAEISQLLAGLLPSGYCQRTCRPGCWIGRGVIRCMRRSSCACSLTGRYSNRAVPASDRPERLSLRSRKRSRRSSPLAWIRSRSSTRRCCKMPLSSAKFSGRGHLPAWERAVRRRCAKPCMS